LPNPSPIKGEGLSSSSGRVFAVIGIHWQPIIGILTKPKRVNPDHRSISMSVFAAMRVSEG
ncbi:MAG: hypothetical protein JAY99_01780, partial [Candidatus Thiodiazotropha lotti]|nr:hypothetical protein [Candidatus Thiodiazotropha lotti]MCW4189998.1 hypothetical protein [Candidatus Thiodiazotropha weberae]